MSARDTVHACWGPDAPDWVWALADECDRSSQRLTAEKIGYTCGTVNQVLRGRRRSESLGNVEDAVRRNIMNAHVECPVLGEISLNRCLEAQARPFAATNPQRVQLWKACRTCHQNRQHQELCHE